MPESPERQVPFTIIGVGNCKNLLDIVERVPLSSDDELDTLKEDEVGVAMNCLPIGTEDATK